MSEPTEIKDPEDILIRRLLIGAGVTAATLVGLVLIGITILLSANFNILNWME
ncbi:MAG: hypothetical protein ACK5NG_00130 [Chthoniobacterales bacterium]